MKKRIDTRHVAVPLLASLALVAGCTGLDNGRYRYDQGWRPAYIVQVGSARTDFPETPFDCRRTQPNVGGDGHDYAYVRLANTHTGGAKYFNSNSQLRHVIVPIRPGTSFREGERVYVNIHDCMQFVSASMLFL